MDGGESQMPVEGWYADPAGGPGQIRWWDGEAWTDHTRAIAIVEIDPSPGAADPSEPPGASGTGASELESEGSAVAVYDASPVSSHDLDAAAVITPPPETPVQAPRTGLIASAIVAGAVAVVAVGVLSGAISPTEPAVAPSGRPIASYQESLGVDEEAWMTELVLRETTTVTIDVRSEAFDAMLHVIRDGDEIAWNDDRGDRAVREHGGELLDPLLEIRLPADTYTLQVSTWGGGSGDFEVTISR